MGRWGAGLFQSDSDLDALDEISADIAVELYYPEDRITAKEKLDSGVLASRFDQYLAEANFENDKWERWRFVLLAAAAMELGAKIEPRHLDVVKRVYKRCSMFPKSQKQVKKALKLWKNDGTPWDHNSLTLIETANMACEEEKKEAKAAEVQDDAEVDVECSRCDKVGKGLKRCSRCKEARYCGRECQMEDWEFHKQVCHAVKKQKTADGDIKN